MVRPGLSVPSCAVIFLLAFVAFFVSASPPAEPESGFKNTLAVQRAMEQARYFLLQADPKKAVLVLEDELPRINGNANYLKLLREAYRTFIKDLLLANQKDIAGKYLDRLAIIDPAAKSDPTLTSQEAARAARDQEVKVQEAKAPAPSPSLAQLAQQTGPVAGQTKVGGNAKPMTARGKVEDDPFDPIFQSKGLEAEKGKIDLAKNLLNRAEAEFSQRNYGQAMQLYDQAFASEPKALEQSKDRWAYCKLNYVVEQLNSGKIIPAALPGLKQDVQTAMSLAPGLADTGLKLLQEIDRRQGQGLPVAAPAETTFTIQHQGKNAQGWQVSETAHFRILHQQRQDLVEQVARIAEKTRLEMHRKWFGQDPQAWTPRCELYLYATAQEYSKATGVPATSPGHSRIESESGGRVIGRRMDLHCENPTMLTCVLPHETTHVVLAGQFGPFAVPRWADEGMAVLSEPADKVEQHRKNLARCARENQLFVVQDLMKMNDYPQPRQISAFYAQSVILVDYLAKQRGPAVFASFVRDGLREGYEPALQKHYGLTGFAELQQRWNQQLAAEMNGQMPAVAGR